MVQKRVSVLQSDHHDKFNKLFKNLKPSSSSSFQHQESDMMKIMKKQRQNLYSPTFRKQIPQPGKPPTPPSMPATSKMQSLIKISEKKPNYMKPTTSSDARKEISQENFKKNSKTTSKSVSALTKTTSFKPTRSGTMKSYPLVETVHQKPTCSSTLKDSKFPDFLTLNSGGTESEGTSIMKVCSYTYCSLNGHHHHPPLPPLKSFLSARRHILKTEISIKMGSFSPRRSRKHRNVIVEENETFQNEVLNKHEDEFFIQIYTKESEATVDRVEIVQELESLDPINYQESFNGNTDTHHSDTDSAEDYSPEENLNENDAIELLEPEINTMEGVENQEDEENSTENNMEDIQKFSLSDSGLYIEEMKVDEVIEESLDHAKSDRNLQSDETNENPNIQADDETDESDIYQYDEIDNTKISKIEVDYEDIVLAEDDNQELKEDCTFDNNYCPSDHISETEDDNQEFKEDTTIDDHYAPFEKKSESDNDNQEVQKQSSTDDHYQPTDQKSEGEDENQEVIKGISIDGHYQQTDQNAVSDSIEKLDKMDESKNMDTIDFDEVLSKVCKTGKWIYKQKESITEEHDLKGFNPRGPNFLELEPDPESEKVDLKHQMMDDRRNSEEWMLDYALQQVVNKLAVARKKKVTLLVEAFETVSPLPKWENTRMGVGFNLQHCIQACR